MSEAAIIAIRWALYIDLGLLFGLPLFFVYALGGDRIGRGILPLDVMMVVLSLVGAVLSVLGFTLQTAMMAGLPLSQTDFALLRDLATETPLGIALQARIAAIIVILLCAVVHKRAARPTTFLAVAASAVALTSLAWSGHGAAGEGSAGWAQLIGDLVHLLAAGAWLGAISAFVWLVAPRQVSMEVARVQFAARSLRGFSVTGSVLVGLIVVTGILNGLFLVGFENVASLAETAYGQLLVVKLALFAGMVALASLNRYRLTPTLERAIQQADTQRALSLLRVSLLVEGGLAVIILWLVAWLGTLSPPMSL